VPGLVAGFDDPQGNQQLDRQFSRFLLDAKWCCTTWGDTDADYRAIPLAGPPLLTGVPRAAHCLVVQASVGSVPCGQHLDGGNAMDFMAVLRNLISIIVCTTCTSRDMLCHAMLCYTCPSLYICRWLARLGGSTTHGT